MKSNISVKSRLSGLSILPLVCLVLSGCSPVEPDLETAVTQPSALCIESPGLQAGVVTRATFRTLGSDSSIGVFLDNVAGNEYIPQNNVRYDYGSPEWVLNNPEQIIYLKKHDAAICAYYPYSSTVTSSAKVDISPRLMADGEPPLAYATNVERNRINNTVSFKMYQACYWLVLKLVRGDIKEACTISEIRLENPALSKECFLNITSGAYTRVPLGDTTLAFPVNLALNKNSEVTQNIVLPGGDILSGGLTIGVTLSDFDNKKMRVTLPGITSLPSATQTEVTLTVNGTYIEVASVNVKEGWDDEALTDADGNEILNP